MSPGDEFSPRVAYNNLANDGNVLVAGGMDSSWNTLDSAEIGTMIPDNHLTGTLILPSGWISSTTFASQFSGITSNAAVNLVRSAMIIAPGVSGSLLSSGVFTTTNWEIGREGLDLPIYLCLRDIYDQKATVISGTVDVDTTAPVISVNPITQYQTNATFPVSWGGTDATSGIDKYDIQLRMGLVLGQIGSPTQPLLQQILPALIITPILSRPLRRCWQ